jgi:hypothetical protein
MIFPYSVNIPMIISGCFVSLPNGTRAATVKGNIAISFAAALALLISIPTGADAVGVGKACDGFVSPAQQCNPGLFCQRKPGQCFISDIPGTCARKPRFCPQITGPELMVCGCDGKTYGNDCMRQQAGFRWHTRESANRAAATDASASHRSRDRHGGCGWALA